MNEISLLWLFWSKKWPEPWFINDKLVRGFVCRHAGTVTCEIKLALSVCYLTSYLERALVCQSVTWLCNTQHALIAFHFCIHRCYFAHWRQPFWSSSRDSNLLSTIQSIVASYGVLRGRLDNLDFRIIYFQT